MRPLKDETLDIFTAASKAQAADDWMHDQQPLSTIIQPERPTPRGFGRFPILSQFTTSTCISPLCRKQVFVKRARSTGLGRRTFDRFGRGLPSMSNERSIRSKEHTSELQSLMRISYAVFCLKKKKTNQQIKHQKTITQNK